MNKIEAMKAYWKNIKTIAETEGVHICAARRFYKHVNRAFGECQHAQSDEEHLSAEKRLETITLLMKRYDISLRSENQRTGRR